MVRVENDNAVRYGKVHTLVGDGAGSFTDSPWERNSSREMSSADYDGDGVADAFGTDRTGAQGGAATVLFGDGSGGYDSRQLSFGYGTGQGAAADVNGDGHVDLMASVALPLAAAQSRLAISLGDGSRDFGPSIYGDLPFMPALAVADFNGDGRLDAANGDRILLNNPDPDPDPEFGFNVRSSHIPPARPGIVKRGIRVRFRCAGPCRVELDGVARRGGKHSRSFAAIKVKRAYKKDGVRVLEVRARKRLARVVRRSRHRVRFKLQVQAAPLRTDRAQASWHRQVRLKR